MQESNTHRKWNSWVERACLAPESVSLHGTFEEVVAYLTGFYQGKIVEAGAVTPESALWMALYEDVLTQYGGVREQPFSAWHALRKRFAFDSDALAEVVHLFNNRAQH